MKNLSYIAASIILLCNLDLAASLNKSPRIANYVSPNKQDYINGHFIYQQCQKSYYKHCFPNMEGKPTYYKASESAQSRIQTEYQKALDKSQSKAREYENLLINLGFLKGTKTKLTATPVLPIPKTSPSKNNMQTFSPIAKSSSQSDNDTSSVGSDNSSYSRSSTPVLFSPTQYLSLDQTPTSCSPEIDQTAHENNIKGGIVEAGLVRFLKQYEASKDGQYSLFQKFDR